MDTGPILLQGRVPVLPGDTPEALEARVLRLEHRLYPKAVRLLLRGLAFPPPPDTRARLGREAAGAFLALSPREKPLYLRAWALLRAWGQEALVGPAFLGQGGSGGGAPSSPPTSSPSPAPSSWRRWRGFPGRSGPGWRRRCG